VVNAKGEEELNAMAKQGVYEAVLNKTALLEFRKKFPVLDDGDDFELSC